MNNMTIMTPRSLEKLSSGARMNFAGSDLFEISRESRSGIVVNAIYSRSDDSGSQLIAIVHTDQGGVLPSPLRVHREPAYARLLSFVERTAALPIVLPRGWRQYKHNNLVSFFALPESLGTTFRWISEVNALGTRDVVFWDLTHAQDQLVLETYEPPRGLYSDARNIWEAERGRGLEALNGPPEHASRVDVVLDPAPQIQGVTKSRPYTRWISDLTPSQREFVEAPTNRSIRLRGPAGSGKTLSMGVKAVREVAGARSRGEAIRVLFVTHSWSLAGEVDELLTALSDQGPLSEVNTLPLVAVAQEVLPVGMIPKDLRLIGEDSLTGKMKQLSQIEEIIDEFRVGNWVTFRRAASEDFSARLDSADDAVRRGLAWDLLIEFGCVLGADGIFPAVNSEQRYLRLHRAPWMMQLASIGDMRSVYSMYESYYETLRQRSLLSSDQLLNDLLNYLESFTWNHRRAAEGYDLVFIDEYHLFNALERQVLRYLNRDVSAYPRLFMALDPRQSPWDVFVSDVDSPTSDVTASEEALSAVKTVDIPTVHRSSPQILELIKHIHLDYANLSLDDDWSISISDVESLATPGPIPSLFVSDSIAGEQQAVYDAVDEILGRANSETQVALAILDEDRYSSYQGILDGLARSRSRRVIQLTSREDIDTLKYHRKGVVVGPAEYLAGLQFDTVLIAGLSNIFSRAPNMGVRRRGALSLLYLAVSRASREVRIFSNDDFGGVPEVLARARDAGVLGVFRN